MFQSSLSERQTASMELCEGIAFSCVCVAWLGMGVRQECRSWMGAAFIKCDDVERESFQNSELPSG